MSNATRRIWLSVTILFAMATVAITFADIATDPGHFVPGIWGDSAKNTFAYLYHVLYGKGYWFTGMNYPYGEHMVYMDSQPLLSVPLSYFKGISVSGALAVMWYSMLLSYMLAIVYVYKILLHFGVKEFAAILFSGLIVVMSPQLYRTLGHFGLSYACVVPMLFYWTLKYNNDPRRRYACYIFFLGIFSTFIHPYLSAIILLWVLSYALGYFVFTKKEWLQKVRHIAPLLFSVLSVFAIVGLIMKATDPMTDRAKMPYGLTEYCARGEHIFTSHYSPFWKYIEEKTGFVQNTSGEEGFSYLGLTVIAAIIFSVVKGIGNRRNKTNERNIVNSTGFKPVWILIAFAALLLGMGVPFVWHMEWIVNYLSFLKQFRTLGRFCWIFYYVMTIYGAVVIYTYYAKYRAMGKIITANTILIGALALWGFEASGYINTQRTAIKANSKNYDILRGVSGNNWPQFLATNHYTANQFQAILLLPLFNISMEKLWVGNEQVSVEIGEGFVAAMQTQLPVTGAMAHSSWSIAEKQVRIAGGPFASKQVLKDLPNNKPFLLLNYDQYTLNPDQEYLLAASDFIGKNNSWRVYACYPERIIANDRLLADSVKTISANLKSGDTCIGCGGSWFVNHFDTTAAEECFFGKGAVPQIMQFETVVADIPVTSLPANGQYEFSCWFLLGDENYKSPYLKLDMLDSTGKALQTVDVLTKESTDNKGLWFRAYNFFTVPPGCSRIMCRLFNEPDNTYKIMDELLLRPSGALIISKSANGTLMANNHLLVQ